MVRLASADIGSNTIRVLIGEVAGSRVTPYEYRRTITRLARGMDRTGRLDDRAMENTLKALALYSEAIRASGAVRTRAVGTSALREAENSGEFLSSIKRLTGLEVEVISGKEESELTALGVVSAVPGAENSLIVDIGGGSTEVMLHSSGVPAMSATYPVGVVKLLERHIMSDPPSAEGLRSLEEECRGFSSRVREEFGHRMDSGTVLIGTAGTMTTLAAMDLGLEAYSRERIHQHEIPLERLRSAAAKLASMPCAKRALLRGLETERADLIMAGIILTINMMETLGFYKLLVSDSGLLEGLLIKLSVEV
jgi:exopolyphosphatase/guanosine-5'-triphosphate,3'-diphosphate pyrophosphatase